MNDERFTDIAYVRQLEKLAIRLCRWRGWLSTYDVRVIKSLDDLKEFIESRCGEIEEYA